MIPGEVYFNDYNGYAWVIRFDKFDGEKIHYKSLMRKVTPSSTEFYFHGVPNYWVGWNEFKYKLRVATKQEILHLEACEAAGKVVPVPSIPKADFGEDFLQEISK